MTLDLFQKEDHHTNGPVTVLGKTFANDEERRAYFREELRKKLPELKEIEGFPIGEDEDIINLSDPPFYTACPNPWINDFIAEWEEEKKQLEKEDKRVPDFEVTEPYAADVSEGKNNPIYNAHSYHTKVPHPAIMRYIMHYTQPGDVVFDGFAGTGMTGVASNHSTLKNEKLKSSFLGNLNTAGLRKSITSDLSPIASFISSLYNKNVNVNKFETNANNIIKNVEDRFSNYYLTKHSNGELCEVQYYVWSEVFECPNCSHEDNFYDLAVDEINSSIKDSFNCNNCGQKLSKKSMSKVMVTEYDSNLNDTILKSKRVITKICYKYKNNELFKIPDEYDYNLLAEVDSFEIKNFIPLNVLPDGSETKRNEKIGVYNTHHFYIKRTQIILSEIYSLCSTNELKFLFTSCITGLTLQQRYRPNSGFPNMIMSGTLYIGSLNREWNIFNWFRGKLKSLIKAFEYNSIETGNVTLIQSATSLILPQNSVDYIFTDPPFGANLNYSELSFVWESWIKLFTNANFEIIENKSVGKSLDFYNRLMTNSFKEYYKILKPGKWMTVEFSNTSAAVWNGIQTALVNAGFIIANVAALDKKQGSFKALNTVTAVKQDLVISCYKPSSEFDTKFQASQHSPMGVWDFVEEHLSHLPIHLVKDNATTAVVERSAKILFDRLIAFYVQRSLPVPIDAGKFQEGLKERFVERDGMYFTQEQVEEYERKKAEVPEFIQMSLFVGSEQDAVYWLRQLLEKERRTESDLHPLWMREVAGNMRKGDTLPEMRQILEENFLKDDTGKWYVPDAENEADLEKLRNKRLLKIFEDYKTEAAKPKGKLKEVRVEALRVGFKQCYQDKDFKTIVTIGDRIPNNLLMEDEVLLQFYDIAAAKI
ncbi:DNA methyltransferase [Empedobacter sp. GD03865]|uniref:DNA methyltransferase n=1 Tax=Empedobacter sp. GD03865 TaxID=2975392 RepID=UPI00244B252E|nr:DNA methyltransferase [Empedobacter sp. GD03865]MDH0660495.1 site-specific DNA-methyltransferase [Empedobacter sp. GD03865]